MAAMIAVVAAVVIRPIIGRAIVISSILGITVSRIPIAAMVVVRYNRHPEAEVLSVRLGRNQNKQANLRLPASRGNTFSFVHFLPKFGRSMKASHSIAEERVFGSSLSRIANGNYGSNGLTI